MQGSGKLNTTGPSSGGGSSSIQYRGYSPQKPKWKSAGGGMSGLLGTPQTNNLVGAGGSGSYAGVQGLSSGAGVHGGTALRSKNKH